MVTRTTTMYTSPDTLPDHIAVKLKERTARSGIRRKPKVFHDTSNFTAIDYGDIIFVDNRYFWVSGYTREGRFGVDDQPKPWVPRTIDLATNQSYILKLVFHETFNITMGDFEIKCYRSPEKEARVIELVQGHERFMQGYAVEDDGGNLVRILDVILGKRLDKYVTGREGAHREYYETALPAILAEFSKCTEGIVFLHKNGLKHGDIRRDHILVEYSTGMFKWIDFDYDFYYPERPYSLDIFELGNILLYIAGRGNYYPNEILNNPEMGDKVLSTIRWDDTSLISKNRIVNLKKIYPYIHEELNNILLHFSQGTNVFYETVDEFYTDLKAFSKSLPQQNTG